MSVRHVPTTANSTFGLLASLFLASVFLAACDRSPDQPADHAVALRRLAAQLEADQIDEAIADLETYLDRVSADPVMRYNLACLLARQDRPDDALRQLRTALDHGYRRLDQARRDQDLAVLHDDPRFEALLRGHADSLTARAHAAAVSLVGNAWSEPQSLAPSATVRLRATTTALEIETQLLAQSTAGQLVVAVPPDPDAYETDRWFEFQFAREGGALVVTPEATITGGIVRVLWSQLIPHRPPLDLLLGINVAFDTPDGRVELVADPWLGRPDGGWRRFAPLSIDPGDSPAPLLVGRPETRLVIGDTLSVELAAQGPVDGEVEVALTANGVAAGQTTVWREFGLGYATAMVALPGSVASWVDLRATTADLAWSGRVYRLPRDWFLTHHAALAAVMGAEQDIVRFWLFKVLRGQQRFDPRDDPTPIAEAVVQTERLLARHAATGRVLPAEASIVTVAIPVGADALIEARLVLPDEEARPRASQADLVLADDTAALDELATNLRAARPDGLALVLPAAPAAGTDQATVALVQVARDWLASLMPVVEQVRLVGVDRAATTAILAATAAPDRWSALALWADGTLDPWPLVDNGDLADQVPAALRSMPRRASLAVSAGGRAEAVMRAMNVIAGQHGSDGSPVAWLDSR
jgi:hypothetical protein